MTLVLRFLLLFWLCKPTTSPYIYCIMIPQLVRNRTIPHTNMFKQKLDQNTQIKKEAALQELKWELFRSNKRGFAVFLNETPVYRLCRSSMKYISLLSCNCYSYWHWLWNITQSGAYFHLVTAQKCIGQDANILIGLLITGLVKHFSCNFNINHNIQLNNCFVQSRLLLRTVFFSAEIICCFLIVCGVAFTKISPAAFLLSATIVRFLISLSLTWLTINEIYSNNLTYMQANISTIRIHTIDIVVFSKVFLYFIMSYIKICTIVYNWEHKYLGLTSTAPF